MIFDQKIVGNSQLAKKQWDEVIRSRDAMNLHEQAVHNQIMQAHGFKVNEGLVPQDVYQEMDAQTVEVMTSDDGDTFLNDMLPQSRSVNIGKLVSKYRKASDAGIAKNSMTGQTGSIIDQVEYSYDGTLVPIVDTAFGRNWREYAAQRSEGFDALIDDQRECTKTIRRKLADNFLDGITDDNGQYITVDSISWKGIRNDDRVATVDLSGGGLNFDFTEDTKTYEQIEAAFKKVRDVLWIDNNAEMPATYYVSRQVAANLERNSSEFASSENKVLQRLAALQGVAAIKSTSKLTGNQMFAIPLGSGMVRPVVCMGVNTVAMPRAKYNDDYTFMIMGAIGYEVKTDYNGNNVALYAAG